MPSIQKLQSLLPPIGAALFIWGLFAVVQLDEKERFLELCLAYSASFVGYLLLLGKNKRISESQFLFLSLVGIGICFLYPPFLSNDFFRFFWDGEMMHQGINPYDFTPIEILENQLVEGCHFLDLFAGMGELSQTNYSCYPFFNQVYFYLGTLFSNDLWDQIFTTRILFLLTFYLLYTQGQQLLKKLGIPQKNIFLLLLNPLFLVESFGNLHFEIAMVTFVVWALNLLAKGNNSFSAVALGIAVQIKLIPLLLFPFLLKYLNWRKTFIYGCILFAFVLVTSLFLIDSGNWANFQQSLRLYFKVFEFNSILLYQYLNFGRWKYGFDMTRHFAPRLAYLAGGWIVSLALFGIPRDLRATIEKMLVGVCIYLSLTSTVHPWYWIFPLCLSIVRPYYSLTLMTLASFFSYGLYTQGFRGDFNDLLNYINLALLVFFVAELIWNKKKSISPIFG